MNSIPPLENYVMAQWFPHFIAGVRIWDKWMDIYCDIFKVSNWLRYEIDREKV